MTAFDDKITAGFGYWRNGAQGSSCTAAILSRECLLWVNNGNRDKLKECPLYPQKQTLIDANGISALGQKRTPALQQVKRSGNLFVARCKWYELSWTSPIEWNVLARISRPLELEVERID